MTDASIDMTGTLSSPPVETASRAFSIASLKAWFTKCRQSVRPWSEFLNTSNFKSPASIQRLLKRAVNNVTYFQGNYLIVSLTLMAYCLLTSPLLLMLAGCTTSAFYYVSAKQEQRKLTIAGKEVSVQQQYAVIVMCALPLFLWAGFGEALFWVFGASCFVISVHAAYYNIEAILKEEDQLDLVVQEM